MIYYIMRMGVWEANFPFPSHGLKQSALLQRTYGPHTHSVLSKISEYSKDVYSDT